ncbi:MAG TPA: SH3 domain-containing protein [Kiritimatiellia bacterium]
MNRKVQTWCAVCALLVGLHAANAAETTTMNVQVKTGQLRTTPAFLGKISADLAYGDQVTVLKAQGEWMQVQSKSGQVGWIHQSALTKKKIKLSAGTQTAQTAASGEELALAGKGFNSDVEAQFKSQNKNIDFSWIDRMEKIKVAPQDAMAFLKEGGVAPAGGSQ